MLTGANFIGSRTSAKGLFTFQTTNPARNSLLPAIFYEASDDEINAACETAHRSLTELRVLPKTQMANFLHLVRCELENSKRQILFQYVLESGLAEDRA
jgi:alpha-ketoglutaric semialdehyde dehydrogenase